MILRVLTCSALALAASHAVAQAAAQPAPPPAPALDLAPSLLQTAMGLAVVVALIFCVGWLVRRTSPGARATSLMKVVAQLPLGQRERAVLIELGEQWLLVGVGAGGVRMLQALPKGTVPAPPKAAASFAHLLAAARGVRPQ